MTDFDPTLTAPVNPRPTWKHRAALAVKLLLAVFLVVYIVSLTDLNSAKSALTSVSVPWLLLGLSFQPVAQILMTGRYWHCLDKAIPFRSLLYVVVVQNSLTAFVASGAGLISFVSILKAENNVSLRSSASALVVTRLADLLCFVVVLILPTIVLWNVLGQLQLVTLAAIAFVGTVVLIFAAALSLRVRGVEMLIRFLTVSRLSRLAIVDRRIESIRQLGNVRPERLLHYATPCLLYTFSLQILSIVSLYCTVRAFHLNLSLAEITYTVTIIQIISYFPVTILGGLGVTDFAIIFLCAHFGVIESEMSAVQLTMRTLFYLSYAGMLLAVQTLLLSRVQKVAAPSNGSTLP